MCSARPVASLLPSEEFPGAMSPSAPVGQPEIPDRGTVPSAGHGELLWGLRGIRFSNRGSGCLIRQEEYDEINCGCGSMAPG